jgi:hypothetical protein
MFVVWRRRAITTDRKTPFFFHDTWSCPHRGGGRQTLTPYLMRSVRVGGSPRQQVAWRLPAIRTCCVEDVE